MNQDSDFIFERYEFAEAEGLLRLHYRYDGGASFEEKITFPPAKRLTDDARKVLDHALRLVFLLAGVSYYKAYAPKNLRCEAFPLDKGTAAFVEKVYRNGLGEFAYRNKLDLSDRIKFAGTDAKAPQAVALGKTQRLLVPVGGGKDSIVSIECLKKAGVSITLYAQGRAGIGLAAPIQATIDAAQRPALKVMRELSPKLMELNKDGALNGHVPITAILSSMAVVCAILHGCDAVVMSNEHSASAPNVQWGGLDINHQYSKSLDFEKDFAAYLAKHVSPDIAYFSLLRPLSEAEIARRFAKLDRYHGIFRSCNTNFKQDAGAHLKNWCRDCPKCRFVFLALAPFIAKPKLVEIFGADMLDDPKQKEGFSELCGLSSIKPFECVGEIAESALLMEKLTTMPAWKDDAVVHELGGAVKKSGKTFDARYNALFAMSPDHRVPEAYLRMLDACR